MHAEVVKREKEVKLEIRELIPQREPFIMVSGLLSADDRSATTFFQVEEGNIFVKDGQFRESGLIENIAQSAAAMNGYHALTGGEPVKNGYIGGLKNLEIHTLPEPGDRLTTLVTETHHVMDTSIIEGEIRSGAQLIARCEMKVFIQS